MKKFEITLRNDKLKQYNWIALFIIIINLALFIYLAIASNTKSIRISSIGAIIIIIISLSIEYFLISIKNNQDSMYRVIAEYIIGLTWFNIGYWQIGLVIFVLGFLYQVAKRPLLVTIIAEKITYPSFPKKSFDWSALNNILLKDGLLTIDLKSNRFIQQPVDETKTSVNEKDFNDFCKQQLNK